MIPKQEVSTPAEVELKNEIICEILKEFKNMFAEQQIQHNKLFELACKANMTNSNNNNSNNQITVNMFLNEYCKDAITVQEFAKKIHPNFDELLYLTELGNKEGVYKILNDALSSLKITERPFHCTDVKRHTTYVKEPEGWKKEQDQSTLKKMCALAEHEYLKTSVKFVDENPEYVNTRCNEYNKWLCMMKEVYGGKAGSEHNTKLVIKMIEEKIQLDKDQINIVIKVDDSDNNIEDDNNNDDE